MNIQIVIISTLIVGGIGICIALFLEFSNQKLSVQQDERIDNILTCLPGNNCGACGYSGCLQLAISIVKEEVTADACPIANNDTIKQISKIMNIESNEREIKVAYIACQGRIDQITQNYVYTGRMDCNIVSTFMNKGPSSCEYGCLGYGSCMSACPQNAIIIVNGVAKVQSHLCIGCAKCISACPNQLITMVVKESNVLIACKNIQKGKAVINACKIGCIGCGICEKACPNEAITMENNIPVIDYSLCDHCMICVDKCPKKSIIKNN